MDNYTRYVGRGRDNGQLINGLKKNKWMVIMYAFKVVFNLRNNKWT